MAGTGRRSPAKDFTELMRVAAVQMNSTADKPANLATAERLVRAAAADGAELIGLPEKWNLLGPPEEARAGAEPLDGPTLSAVAGWARELDVAILAGSIVEAAADGQTRHNTSVLIDAHGEQLAAYRKIHMFDVDVGGISYRESEVEQAGEELVSATCGIGDEELEVGLTICYDVRFPELVPDPGRARGSPVHRSRRVHDADGRGPLGGAAAQPGRSRTRRSCLRPGRSARRPRTTTAGATR